VIEAHRRDPQWVGLAITDGASGELLGNIALTIVGAEQRVAEGHYWLARGARGRGAASDAVWTIAEWAFASLPIDEMELLIHRANVDSERVARRAGFEEVGERDGRRVFSLERRAPTGD
jgi:RimJ/RimL family protein N-acetyltransferase